MEDIIELEQNEELKAKIKDLQEKIKIIQEQREIQNEEFKKLITEQKLNTERSSNLKAKLEILLSNFTPDALKICNYLKNLYLNDQNNKLIRNSFQLSIIGIFWTEILEIPGIHGTRELDFLKSGQSMDLGRAENVWEKISITAKYEISNWISKFFLSTVVKPEALISENLWSFVLRKISMCLNEENTATRQVQCFGQYNTGHVAAISSSFFTDQVFLAGCSGIPLLLVEMAVDLRLYKVKNVDEIPHPPEMHKDLKKLAVQMGGVLLQLIGAIKSSGSDNVRNLIANLRIFGALISGTSIQFCVSRPEIQDDGKFLIIFDTNSEHWTFDLFCGLFNESFSFPSIQTTYKFDIKKEIDSEEIEKCVEESIPLFSDSAAELNNDICVPMELVPESRNFGFANFVGLDYISKFIGTIHLYYQSLPEELLVLYQDLDNPSNGHEISYPQEIYNVLYTKSGPLQQENFSIRVQSNYFTVSVDAPLNYNFVTLPNILYVENIIVDPPSQYRFDHYQHGATISEIKKWIESLYNLSLSQRIFRRAQFIIDILMGIFEAYKAGYVFATFEEDDFIYRDHLFCIRTYRHVIAVVHPDAPELLSVLKRFVLFYSRCWYMDFFFTEGDPDYLALRRLENTTLGKIQDWTGNEQIDWKKLFTDAVEKYELILKDLKICFYTDDTACLLMKIIQKISFIESVKVDS